MTMLSYLNALWLKGQRMPTMTIFFGQNASGSGISARLELYCTKGLYQMRNSFSN